MSQKLLPSLVKAASLYQYFHGFRLETLKAPSLFRFGGPPPLGVRPRKEGPFTAFLLTVPITDTLGCSVFINLTGYDNSSPYYVFSGSGVIQDEQSALIEATVHTSTLELETKGVWDQFPAMRLVATEEGVDAVMANNMFPDPEACFDHHKFGGFPYYYQPGDDIIQQTNLLILDGFRHVFQLAFPGPQDRVMNFDWPFGELVFHIFLREEMDNHPTLRFVWS